LSVTIEQDQELPGSSGGDVANEDDVRRTLQELQRKHTDVERELASERAKRLSLESNLTSEQIARTTAEADRDTHAARVTTEAEARWNAEKSQATTAITSTTQALDAAEEDYARHAELGEWKDAAKAQRAIAEHASELNALKQKQQWLDNNKEKLVPKPAQRVVEQPRRQQEQVRPPSHRYAQHISGDLVGGEEAWLDARPQFQSDQNYREDVFAASNVAARKHARGTDAYFGEIERILGEEGRQRTTQDDPPGQQQPRSGARQNQSADLAPSRRSGPGQQPAGSQQEWRLTPDEKEMADGMYGNPNSIAGWYEPDPAKRYKRYYDNAQLMKAQKG
jgi:hypothetical protein